MDFSLSHLWATMGLVPKLIIVALGLMSVASLVVIVERVLTFGRSSRESRAFAARLAPALSKGDLTLAAATESGGQPGHLGRVIGAGLTAFRIAPGDRDTAVESIARALERSAQRELHGLRRGLAMLATVGSTAPFVGLLGTVMGIVNAFQQMSITGSGGLGPVSGGISEALITTALGLLVAIPAVMGFNFLQGWVDARGVDLAESSNEFLDVVARHYAAPRS